MNNNNLSDTLFSEFWFSEHIENSVSDLGHRYTPELNIELDISKKFAAICRNKVFKEQVKEAFHELLLSINTSEHSLSRLGFLQTECESLASASKNFEEIYRTTQINHIDNFDIDLIKDSYLSATDAINSSLAIIHQKTQENKDYNDNESHTLRATRDELHNFQTFLDRKYFDLANQPLMLLSGEAGIGKSHLLADIALNTTNSGLPCILLLGQQFTSTDSPWTQIFNNHIRLGFKKEDDLLSELNTLAEENGERILFMIDAINEGQGCYFWPDHIKSFIRKFSNYPWLGLVLSVRSSYEKLLIPKDLISPNEAVRVVHRGFSNVEYQASSFFFAQYEIEQPSIPLLHPEFSNPLFLKLFCEGINRSGLTRIPKGHTGISSIINFFLDSIDKKLCVPKLFDYPCNQHLVKKVVNEIISYKLENNTLQRIEYLSNQISELQKTSDLETRVEEVQRLKPIIEKLKKELEEKKEKAIGFSIQEAFRGNFIPYDIAFEIADKVLGKFSNKRRFLDTLISEGVLSKNLYWLKNGEHEEGIYLAYERFEDHFTASHILSELQTPEQLKEAFREESKLANYINYSSNIGVLEALSIQIPEHLGCELYECLNEEEKSNHAVMETFLNSLLWRKTETIGAASKKYINEYILRYEHTYSQFWIVVYSVVADPEHPYNADGLHCYLMQPSLSMAERDAEWTTFLHHQNYEEVSIRRCIDWALSKDDKSYLSDDSRLLASKALAWIFPSTNIPFRDSATEGLVNLLKNNILIIRKLLIEFKSVNDPYVYERIFAAAYGAVLCSENLEGLSELAQYIVEYLFDYSNEIYPNVLVRDYARNIVEYTIYKELVQLDDKEIIRPPYKSDFPNKFPSNDDIDAYKYDYNAKDFKDYYWGQNSILSSMGTEHGRSMYGDFGRYTFQSKVYDWDFDANDLSNYACKIIFEEYGYDVEMHGMFDRHASTSRNGRHDNITERIGKKYQWIALYEVLARLSDNHKMIDESTRWGDEKKHTWYQGTWKPFVRNIDPTAKVFSPKIQSKMEQYNWWNTFKFNDWTLDKNNWLVSDKDLPCHKEPITVIDPNGVEWLVMESYQDWEEDIPIGVKKYEYPHKELWIMLKSVLVKNEDHDELYSWMKEQHFMGRWFPEGKDNQYQVFSKEYYWSPAYHFFSNPYYSGEQWVEVTEQHPSNKLICNVSPTSEGHIWESGANYNDAPNYLSPRLHMFEGMDLQYSKNIGEWLDSNGVLACFDPSIKHGGSSCLLIRKDIFQSYLDKHQLKIIWTVLGVKQITGTGFGRNEFPRGIEFSGLFTFENNHVEGGITQVSN